MRLIIGFFLSFISLLISTVSLADQLPETFNGVYLGANVSRHHFENRFTDDYLVGGNFRAGYDFNRFIALEGQIGATTAKSYILVNDLGQNIGDYRLQGVHSGVYARANWRLVNVTLYALAGVGYYKANETISNTGYVDGTTKTDATGFSYGVGVDLFGGLQTALSLNWLQLINKDIGGGEKMRVDALYFGITYYFKPQKTNYPFNPRDRIDRY